MRTMNDVGAMIFGLSQKLNDKIKVGKLGAMPLDENPLADWSAQLFAVGRTQYILLANRQSGYGSSDHADPRLQPLRKTEKPGAHWQTGY